MNQNNLPFEQIKEEDRLSYLVKISFLLSLFVVTVMWLHDIFVPLAIASLLALAVLPFVDWLQKKKISKIFAIIITLLLITLLIAGFLWLVITQVQGLVRGLPDLTQDFERYIDSITSIIQENFGISVSEQTGYLKDAAKEVSTYAGRVLMGTGATIGALIQIPVYFFLLLLYSQKISRFLTQAFPHSDSPGSTLPQKIREIVNGYVNGMLIVITIIAVLNTIGLLILGIPYAIFFGILAAVLTLIPYIGNFIGGSLPIILALITKDSYWYAVGVVIVFVVVQFLEGNLITPRIVGSKVTVNALAAILALLFGAKVLGITGMILAIPFLGIAKIFLETSPRLKPVAELIDDRSFGYTPSKTKGRKKSKKK